MRGTPFDGAEPYKKGIPSKRSGYAADESCADGLFSIRDVCSVLYEFVFNTKLKQPLTPQKGLIVISGATDSCKSLVTRGLIDLYLDARRQSADWKRRPHLVTFEDPIEERYWPNPPADYSEAQEQGVDYTPRERGTDADSLRDVLKDALRQTPAVLYVGELREQRDWRELIDFAGTGHMIVTTAHSGSLAEAMARILEATGARSPGQRASVIDRVLALVHLRLLSVTSGSGVGEKALVPALWRRAGNGPHSLVSDGLTAIVPNYPSSDHEERFSSLGRRWFVEKLYAANVEPAEKQRREACRLDLQRQTLIEDLKP